MKWLLSFLIALQLSGCKQAHDHDYQPSFGKRPDAGTREYVVGIAPFYNPQCILAVFGPILDTLNARIPEAHFKLETSLNHEEFLEKLNTGHFDLAFASPYDTVLALKHHYHVFATMGEDASFRGLIVARKDSGINTVGDLKGKKVAYSAATELATAIMPQYYLHTHGIDVNRDISNVYLGSSDTVLREIWSGHVSAGGVGTKPWRKFILNHPGQASQLEVKWQTEPLVNDAWLARQDLAPALADKLFATLLDLHNDAAGRQMLSLAPGAKFEAANDADYAKVRNFLETFSRNVREIER
ncbi:MAG: phosphate/phosphite/phosphonate ABC transporter substrate-binding protein [Nitrosomonadales bacterium]|nr:phosphate/phosphite/phosphonate ABC transporter substrate-binding protein [Nitrosomonadales bacterium]